MCNCTKLRVIVCTKNYTLRDLSNCNIPPPLKFFLPTHPPKLLKKHPFMQEKKCEKLLKKESKYSIIV